MDDEAPPIDLKRRQWLKKAAGGATFVALGGLYVLASDDLTREAQAQTRADGRPRLPPGQHVIKKLKDMGGEPGSPKGSEFKLKVHGDVEAPFTLDFKELLKMRQTVVTADVHCVTTWSVMGAKWKGVLLQHIAKRAKLKKGVRHVIFEAAHGYTANVPLKEALKPNVLIAHRLNGRRLARAHGTPVRSVVPDLYFWKSAKWLTGIRFSKRDKPGYWETRGYNNHGDPWLEERYS